MRPHPLQLSQCFAPPDSIASALGAALVLTGLVLLVPVPADGAGPTAATATAPAATVTAAAAAAHRSDDEEHGPFEPHGIELSWPAGSRTLFARLAEPSLRLRLVNLDPVAYAVVLAPLEDAGSLQTRRLGEPISATLPPRGQVELTLRFGAGLPRTLSHSGMVVALLNACPLGGGPCLNGASDPLFFHPQGDRWLVYGERVLCKRFRCGALAQKNVKLERGDWRVLGGGPLHAVTSREEPDHEDDGFVDGGDL
jgi:hypothetical protein